jgi:hypothetical protein
VKEQVSVEDAAALQTENVLRITAEDWEQTAEWCRQNLKGAWQIVRRRFADEDQDAVIEAAQRERVRNVRYLRGSQPLVYRFEIWELRIEDAEEASNAKLALAPGDAVSA